MNNFPKVIQIQVLNATTIVVHFSDGLHGSIDFSDLFSFGLFSALRDPNVFYQAQISFGTLQWPGGIDLDPEWLYQKLTGIRVAEPKAPDGPGL
jgi:hypothetical protein